MLDSSRISAVIIRAEYYRYRTIALGLPACEAAGNTCTIRIPLIMLLRSYSIVSSTERIRNVRLRERTAQRGCLMLCRGVTYLALASTTSTNISD